MWQSLQKESSHFRTDVAKNNRPGAARLASESNHVVRIGFLVTAISSRFKAFSVADTKLLIMTSRPKA
jgi:hypothetical protein